MPDFVASWLGGLVNIAGVLAGRVMLALGFGTVSYAGLSTTLTGLKAQLVSTAALLPPELLQLLSYLKVGEFVSLICSALTVRMILNGLQAGGSIFKLVKGS